MKLPYYRISLWLMPFFISFAILSPLRGQIVNPSNCGLGIAIPDSSCNATNQFRILVNNVNGSQLGINTYLEEVRLIIAHTWVSDLDIALIAPSGVRVELSTDNGADEDNYGDPSDASCGNYISFSVNACNKISVDTIPPFVGSYQPEGNLLDFNDGSNPNGQWILEICDDAGDDNGSLEFVELVFSPVVCFAPTNIIIEDIDSTTVRLNWQPSASCTNTIIEYGLPGFQPGTGATAGAGGTVVRAGCPPFNLMSLQARTVYEVYIREQCGADNFSTNSCPIALRTNCLPPPISIIETFDNQADCINICGQLCDIQGIWSNQAQSSFDWIVESGETATIGTGPSDDVTGGGKYIYIETSGSLCRNGRAANLISRCIEIDTTGSDSCHFSFNYHLFGNTIGSLALEISNDGGSNWTTIWNENGNLGDRWFKQYINLSAWHGQIAQLRFVGKGGSSATGDIAIDQLVFYGSKDLGSPSYEFFVDSDGDGFGDVNNSIKSCYPTPPSGYVNNSQDCNDNNAAIHPNALEVPCNQIDENCNGDLDDRTLAPPATQDTTVCAQQVATVFATAPPEGFILWYGSPTGLDLLEFDQGSGYSVLATDTLTVYAEAWFGFECKSIERTPATIIVQPNPNLVAAAIPPICQGESINLQDINIIDQANTNSTLTYHTGTPTNINNQIQNLLITPQNASTVFVAAQTDKGCKDELFYNIEVNKLPQASIIPADTTAVCSEGEVTLSVMANNPNADYTYIWSSNEVGDKIKVKSSNVPGRVDVYSLTITDTNGCNTTDSVWIEASNGIGAARITPTEVSSCDGSDGSLLVEPLSGTPPFNYFWSGAQAGSAQNQASAFTIPNLKQGIYRVTVTDSSPLACEIQLPFTLVNGPSARVRVDSNIPVQCPGGSDGKICLEVRGVNPTILWSTGATTTCIEGLKPGKYSVTVTDDVCETILTDLEITAPAAIRAAAKIIAPSCAEKANGQINLLVTGGTTPYSLFWEDGSNFEARQNLKAGQYPVQIVDFQNCTYQDTIELTAPDTLRILVDQQEDPTCFELNNGKIQPRVVGGTAPYFFEWSNNTFDSILSNLGAGTYQLTVTDIHQCTQVGEFILNRPTPLALTVDEIKNASCAGVTDGTIKIQASGGTPDYFYQWNDNQNGSTRSNLGAGQYIVTAFDANSCRITDSFNILAPPTIQVNRNITTPKCQGSQDGILDLVINNATIKTYAWSEGSTTQDLRRIRNGAYCVSITDVNGCTLDTCFTVTAPQLITANITQRPPSCANSKDGSIELKVTTQNGLPPRYNWNTGENSKDISSITAGNYVVTISDADGCTLITDSIIIENPEPIIIEADRITPVQCSNEKSGGLEINVQGGVEPYQYNWSSGEITEDLFDIPSGNYKLVVLDKNRCAVESPLFTVAEPIPLNAKVRIVQDEICQLRGGKVDSVVLLVQGGRPPYQYTWSNGTTKPNLVNVAAGDYSVTITDRSNCSFVLSSIKVQPPQDGFIVTTQKNNISCYNANDGSILARVIGGTAPYLYHLSQGNILNRPTDTLLFSKLAPGSYNLTITDKNGCTTVASNIFIAQPAPFNIQLDENAVQNIKCVGETTGSIQLKVTGGTRPLQFLWVNSNSDTVSRQEDLFNVGADTYTFLTQDANGCKSFPRNFTIKSPAFPITFSNIETQDIACFGDATGSIQLRVTGGVAPYQFNWNEGLYNTRDLDSLKAGVYQLQVTDENGCIKAAPSIVVDEPDLPIQLRTNTVKGISCVGAQDGAIEVEVAGGFPPYALFWESIDVGNPYVNGDTPRINELEAGNYKLSVLDGLACSESFYFVVNEPSALNLTLRAVPATLNKADGSITVEVTGGTAPYSYIWSLPNAPQTDSLKNLVAGFYTVTVEDANGCIKSATIEVEVDTPDAVWDLAQFGKITLTPNPTAGDLNLYFDLNTPQKAKVALYAPQGQLIEVLNFDNISTKHQQFNIQHLPNGYYALAVTLENVGIKTFLILKQEAR